MAEPAADPERDLLGELSAFARDEADALSLLAERIEELSARSDNEAIDIDGIWASVEARMGPRPTF